MRPRLLAPFAALALVAGIATAAVPRTASAAEFYAYTVPNGGMAYDIESSNFYCTGGGTACIPNGYTAEQCAFLMATCPGGFYADVEAFGPPDGSTNGTPDELTLQCARSTNYGYDYGFVDVVSPKGNTDYGGTSTNTFKGVYGNSAIGTIGGKATVFNDPFNGTGSEDNPAQTSSVNVTAWDPFVIPTPTSYAIGTVTGTQNTNNSTDTLNSGQFTITIRGTLWHYYSSSPTSPPVPYSGTISCVAGGPHAYDLANAGLSYTNVAEGEIEPALGDNQLYAMLLAARS